MLNLVLAVGMLTQASVSVTHVEKLTPQQVADLQEARAHLAQVEARIQAEHGVKQYYLAGGANGISTLECSSHPTFGNIEFRGDYLIFDQGEYNSCGASFVSPAASIPPR